MSDEKAVTGIHPGGESKRAGDEAGEGLLAAGTSLNTFGGKIQVRWMPEAAVSAFGQMAFFIEFLKTSGLFDALVNDCPLRYTSRNAPKKRDVLGTILLSVLAGHWRYAHINAIRGDGVNPGLLGITARGAAAAATTGERRRGSSGEAGTAVARLPQFVHRQSAIVDNHMAGLRAKLERGASEPRHIKTVHGVGYKFIP